MQTINQPTDAYGPRLDDLVEHRHFGLGKIDRVEHKLFGVERVHLIERRVLDAMALSELQTEQTRVMAEICKVNALLKAQPALKKARRINRLSSALHQEHRRIQETMTRRYAVILGLVPAEVVR